MLNYVAEAVACVLQGSIQQQQQQQLIFLRWGGNIYVQLLLQLLVVFHQP